MKMLEHCSRFGFRREESPLMSDRRRQTKVTRNQYQPGFHPNWHLRVLWLARRFIVLFFAIVLAARMAPAQSQSVSPPQPQTRPQPKRLPPKTVPSIADVARNAKSEQAESAPAKVITDDDLATLPPGGISIVGPPPSTSGTARPKAKPADDTAKVAAYWKARFTAARQKLAQDKQVLPGLEAQLKVDSLQEIIMDEDTGQVYSDTYMDLLHQIDLAKLTIQNDKKALSDLHDEFRHAGGLPGWIR